MVNWPLRKRKAVSRDVVKEKSWSVQWWTVSTRSVWNALMEYGGLREPPMLPRPERPCASAGVAHLALQVVQQPHLGDQVDLRLEVVDVFLGVFEDALQDLARDVVAHGLAMGDADLHG